MSSDAKATRLNKLNVEKLYELNFNKTLSSLTPFEFADQVISKGLGLRHLVVGKIFVSVKVGRDSQRFNFIG